MCAQATLESGGYLTPARLLRDVHLVSMFAPSLCLCGSPQALQGDWGPTCLVLRASGAAFLTVNTCCMTEAGHTHAQRSTCWQRRFVMIPDSASVRVACAIVVDGAQVWGNCREFNREGDEVWKAGAKSEVRCCRIHGMGLKPVLPYQTHPQNDIPSHRALCPTAVACRGRSSPAHVPTLLQAKFARLWAAAGLPDSVAPRDEATASAPPPRIRVKLPAGGGGGAARSGDRLKIRIPAGGGAASAPQSDDSERLATAAKVGSVLYQ